MTDADIVKTVSLTEQRLDRSALPVRLNGSQFVASIDIRLQEVLREELVHAYYVINSSQTPLGEADKIADFYEQQGLKVEASSIRLHARQLYESNVRYSVIGALTRNGRVDLRLDESEVDRITSKIGHAGKVAALHLDSFISWNMNDIFKHIVGADYLTTKNAQLGGGNLTHFLVETPVGVLILSTTPGQTTSEELRMQYDYHLENSKRI